MSNFGQGFTCPNPSCSKTFTNPLKAQNLRSKNAQAYDACPYCLAEITVEKDHESDEETRGLGSDKAEREVINVIPLTEKTGEPSSGKSECAHYLGYLSKRQAKEKIPEECMMCGNIVQCMLKGVTC